ncbi:MAG: ATP-binding cassette domain-containing protein [Thomasclavelia sp.]
MKININDISREIKSNMILNHITLEFESGKIYGLCGHNGSGKTMLLRAIADLIQIDKGEIVIYHQTLHQDIDYPPEMGLIIEIPTFFKYYTRMKQSLAIAQAIMKKKQLILLDESANTSNQDAILQFKKIMIEKKCIIPV